MSDLAKRLDELCERHRLDGSHLAYIAATSNLPTLLAALREAAAELGQAQVATANAMRLVEQMGVTNAELTAEVERLRADAERLTEDNATLLAALRSIRNNTLAPPHIKEFAQTAIDAAMTKEPPHA